MKGEKYFRKIWISGFFICFVLLLLSSTSGLKQPWNPAEQLIVEIAAPFQKLINRTINLTKDFWLNYFSLIDVRHENSRLKQEINSFKRENSQFKELLATHERLRKLLQFKEVIQRPVIAAQVIGLDPTGWFKSIIIDKGKKAGLKWDMPVVNASGVVGRIVSVSIDYAKVLLIIDQNSAVDCLTQQSRDRGMVKGLSTDVCEMDYMAKSSDAVVGEMVITSGLGGIFPKGLPVGKISRVKDASGEFFKEIEITPSVDFSKLEEVLVIQTASSNGEQSD
ncbi:MAG: rod shape-determining protein MreC [Desulfobacteraceae bacterium]|uniref:Cell shape-determining protein MreC n=1 Tax=Candidatus Desulfacyla euxinica TaxID=2841693 RepID=A0A8J6MV42_9DELT|nr:rod shape-determining protein MreC [Candidatus Desulfacyla euxinica]MBL6978229.1 rod shape-determining protein MreC [Desulfobacteraceae bacterium]